MPLRISLTPAAPASGTPTSCARSTYAALPAVASRDIVASAASIPAVKAVERSALSYANVMMKAARGSTSVREGGRARV
mgnify:CR=1 FL=1